MKESKCQLEMEQESLRRREQLCPQTCDNHLQQMRQMQDLMLAETEKPMQEKRNKAEVEVETIQQQIEAKMNVLKDQLAKTEGERTKLAPC